MIRVADVIARYIVEDMGVDTCFCITGAGIMHLTDGVAQEPRLKTIFPHHEQSSSMAVDSYSRLTGKVGVALFSTGPASTNAITGLAGCWQDSVPALFISGQVKRAESTYFNGLTEVRQFGVQELDILPVVKPLTKWSTQLSQPEQVLAVLDEAVFRAKDGRPGPVWIEVPMDVQAALVEPENLPRYFPPSTSVVSSNVKEIERVIDLLRQSKRPLVLAGQGLRIADAVAEFSNFLDQTGIPFVTPYLGVDLASTSQDLHVGVTGVKGERAANWAMQSCDLLLVFGSSMHVSVTGYEYEKFAPEAHIIVVDIDAAAFHKGNLKIDTLLHANLKYLIPEITLNLPNAEQIERWVFSLKKTRAAYPVISTSYSEGHPQVNIYEFLGLLNRLLKPEDCVISDAGSAFYAASQAIEISHTSQRYITSGAMATMGFSIPAAIGAAASGHPRIIAITGDGSFHQNSQELSLFEHHKFNVKLIVFNNDGYLSIRTSQQNYYQGREFGTDAISGLPLPHLGDIARAYKLPHLLFDADTNLEVLENALESQGPVIIEVVCPPNQPIIPTVGSKINPDGSMTSAGLDEMSPLLDQSELISVLNFLKGHEGFDT